MTGLREDEREALDRALAAVDRLADQAINTAGDYAGAVRAAEDRMTVRAILAARAAQTDAATAPSNLARAKQTADWDAAQGPATSHSPDDRTVPSLLAGILDALIACAEVRA